MLPGWIDTDLTRGAREQVPGLNERVLARTPAGRWGVPADLAGIAVFLASSASDFVTGTAIPVDGGYSISSALRLRGKAGAGQALRLVLFLGVVDRVLRDLHRQVLLRHDGLA